MGRFLIRRLLWLVPVMLVVGSITFGLMQVAPGGPWDRDPNRRQIDAATQANLNRQFGLDKEPWLDWDALGRGDLLGFIDTQFITYMIGGTVDGEWKCGIICGNMGPSFSQRGRTVQDIVLTPPEDGLFWDSKAGYSFRLALLAVLIAVGVGLPMGILAALRQNTWIDYLSLFIATIGITVPNFVMGIFLIIIFAVWLHLIPVLPRDWSDPRLWILPAIILGANLTATTARLARSSLLEIMRQDYVRTAHAKGLAGRVIIVRHMLKNSLIPVVTVVGPNLIALVVGSFIIETMFGFPGWGRQYVTAISQRDYSMIMATTLVFAFLVQLANMTVDIIYGFLDPRIRVN